MSQTQLRPVPLAKVTGLGNLLSSAERKTEHSLILITRQVPIGAIRLSQRFGLSVSTATAVAEANMWGRP